MKILIIAVLLLIPSLALATELDDFMKENNLDLPRIAADEIKKNNLIAACGIKNSKDNTFTIFVLKKDDIPMSGRVDLSKAVMTVKYFLTKKKITVEYRQSVLWGARDFRQVTVFVELFPL